MRKLAIFVEGNTELVFVEKLVIEIAGYHQVHISRQLLHGDRIRELHSVGVQSEDAAFFVLIVNCESDGKVKSAMLERIPALSSQGYELVLGLRDAYPINRSNLRKLLAGLLHGLDCQPIRTHIVVAIMEVEAWFIGEWTHFQRISPELTPDFIETTHNIDVRTVSAEALSHPAATLGEIYKSVGLDYKKKNHDAHAVAARLDYATLYADTREKIKSLKVFLDYLDGFFTPPNVKAGTVTT